MNKKGCDEGDGVFTVVMVLIIFGLCYFTIVGIVETFVPDEKVLSDKEIFCNERNMSYNRGDFGEYDTCYKIQNDTLIEKNIREINGDLYLEDKNNGKT